MKKLSLILIALFVTALAIVSFATKTKANPMFFERFQTAAATTTVVYMQPGTATTTLSAINTQNTAFESALVNVQVIATSTGVTGQILLNVRVEGSMDNVDWYPIALPLATATTTLLTSNPFNTLQLAISTSTSSYGFGGSGSATQIMESFSIPTVERHLRVVFTDPVGGGKYGIWSSIITTRQSN